MFYIYILYSPGTDKFYVGYTNDIERRLQEHNELSDNSFTSKYRPWILKSSFEVGNNRGVAMKIEKHIKRQRKRTYIEEIIKRSSITKLIERYSVG